MLIITQRSLSAFSTGLPHLLPYSTLTTGCHCLRLISHSTWENTAPSINACVTLGSVRVVRPGVLVTISWRSAHSTTCSHAKSPDFKHLRQMRVLCFPSKPFEMNTLALNPLLTFLNTPLSPVQPPVQSIM